MGDEESEHLNSTCEVGEPTRGTPRREGGCRDAGPCETSGERHRAHQPYVPARTDSVAEQQAAGLVRGACPRIEANPQHEEPDAVVPQVRICGGPGWATARVYPTPRSWGFGHAVRGVFAPADGPLWLVVLYGRPAGSVKGRLDSRWLSGRLVQEMPT